MKCSIEELPHHIEKLAPIYLLSGDDPYLLNEASDAIRASARKQGFERIRITADSSYDWTSLPAELMNISLFSSQRLFDIHVPNAKFGDKGSKILQEIVNNDSTDTVILITTSKLDAARQRAKWFKSLEKVGVVVTIWPLDNRRFGSWCAQHAKQRGLNLERDALAFLTDKTEGNLNAAHQEIEKLALIYPPGNITLAQVTQAVSDNSRYDVFKLIDCCLQGDPKRSVKIFNSLYHQGTEAIFILWALSRELRTLIKCHERLQQGQALGQFAMQLGIWPQRRPLVQQALKRLSAKQSYHLLESAQQIDMMIKGVQLGDPWMALRDLSLNLSGLEI